jgi:hypothetical protein
MIRTNKDKVRKDQESCIQSVLYKGVTLPGGNWTLSRASITSREKKNSRGNTRKCKTAPEPGPHASCRPQRDQKKPKRTRAARPPLSSHDRPTESPTPHKVLRGKPKEGTPIRNSAHTQVQRSPERSESSSQNECVLLEILNLQESRFL